MRLVIKSIFGLQPNRWDSKIVERGTFRSPWKAISSLYREFLPLVSFRVGNGNNVRFWEDKWLGDNSLQELFPSLFRLSVLKAQPISAFLDGPSTQVAGTTNWNFHFPRNLLDSEIKQLQDLLQILERLTLCPTVEDKRVWLADSSGIFFV